MYKIINLLIISSMFLVYVGCNNGTKVPPHPNFVPTDTELCELAGKNLVVNKCIQDDKTFTKRGKSFKEFCEETQNNGIWLNPKCLSNIKADNVSSCQDQMNACTYSK